MESVCGACAFSHLCATCIRPLSPLRRMHLAPFTSVLCASGPFHLCAVCIHSLSPLFHLCAACTLLQNSACVLRSPASDQLSFTINLQAAPTPIQCGKMMVVATK